jgi:hypothetical protein
MTEIVTETVYVVETVEVGLQGPPGPPGLPGPPGGAALTAPAGETLSGHRVVRLVEGMAFYCDAATLAHAGTAIGLTTGAALASTPATIQTLGNLTEPAWSFVEGPVYVGLHGFPTQSLDGVFLQQIGVAVSATTLNINPQISILRG